jgi:hypothetical protein
METPHCKRTCTTFQAEYGSRALVLRENRWMGTAEGSVSSSPPFPESGCPRKRPRRPPHSSLHGASPTAWPRQERSPSCQESDVCFSPMLMNSRQESEQAIMTVPSGVQANVTSLSFALIPASFPRRHSSGRSSFPQPSHTMMIGIGLHSGKSFERRAGP